MSATATLVHVQDLVPLSQWHIEVLHLLIQQGNSWFDQARAALQYMVEPSGNLRDMSRHPPETWPELKSGLGQAAIWRSQGLDLEAIIQEVLKIRRPLQKYHGGQLEKIYGQQHLIWEHPKISEALGKMSVDSVQSRVVTSVKSVWKCLSAVHREVHQAHPDVDVVKGYVSVFLREVDVLRSQDTPKPCRYRGKFYDHALASHVVKDLENLKGHDLGLVHFCTRSLEHNNRPLKALYSRIPAGGDPMQRSARIEIVYKRLFAMNRMLRRSCYKQMDSEDKMRELLEASSSDSEPLEPNSDTDSESSVESGGSGPSHNFGEGCSVPDQFATP
jgi:hypothetical protein